MDFDASIDQVDAAIDWMTEPDRKLHSVQYNLFFLLFLLLFSSLLLFLLLYFSHYLFSKDKFKCALDTREKLVNCNLQLRRNSRRCGVS